MKQQINEVKKLQKIAGLIIESQVNESKYSPAVDLEQRIAHLLDVVSTSSKIPTEIKSELVGEFNQIAKIISSMAEADEADSFYDDEDDDYGSDNPEDDHGPMEEDEISEAYVPSNIKDFAKRKGITALVNKVAGWAEKAGKGIRGGTAVGKNYNTLVLDLNYQDGAIRINISDDYDEPTIELYGEPVYNAKSFAQILASQDTENN